MLLGHCYLAILSYEFVPVTIGAIVLLNARPVVASLAAT
jgi:hypothetical protein